MAAAMIAAMPPDPIRFEFSRDFERFASWLTTQIHG